MEKNVLRKTTKLAILVASVLFLVGAAACGSGGSEGDASAGVGQRVETADGSYVDITAEELRTMLEENDLRLVNVHVPYAGDIGGTDLSIPYDEIAENVDQLPPQLDAKIVVYCRSGNMSETAANALVNLGYTNVWNLTGGMIAWEEAGYSLADAGS
jgi:rhodanese-related sulfurtransferase